jgi:hypothetical protein
MGFIKVRFREVRNVVIDAVDSNQQTGQTIEVEAGLHTITLSGPADYWPPRRHVMVGGSGPLNPMEVHFEKN